MSIVNQKNKKLILIAEDDISIRTVLSSDLEQKFNLKLTDSASQLWEWVSNGVGDLIILDVVMPDANGIEYFKCWFLLHIAKLRLTFCLEVLTT